MSWLIHILIVGCSTGRVLPALEEVTSHENHPLKYSHCLANDPNPLDDASSARISLKLDHPRTVPHWQCQVLVYQDLLELGSCSKLWCCNIPDQQLLYRVDRIPSLIDNHNEANRRASLS